MFGNLGFTELVVIFVIALIIFGPRKLPELGKTLGNTLGQFKRASEDFKRSWEEEVEVEKRRIVDDVKDPGPPTPTIQPAENAIAQTREVIDVAPPATTEEETTPEPADRTA